MEINLQCVQKHSNQSTKTRSVHKNTTVHVNYEGISYSRIAAQLNCWQSSSAQQNQQHLIWSFWSNKLSRLLLKYIKLHIIYLYSDIWTCVTSVSSADSLDPVVNHGAASLLIVQDHFQWDPALSGVRVWSQSWRQSFITFFSDTAVWESNEHITFRWLITYSTEQYNP